MFFYFIVFFIIVLLYNGYRSINNQFPKFILFLLCFVLPVILASCRDLYNFGKDLELYGISTFETASSFSNFFAYWLVNGNEIGYCALNWCVAQVSNNVRVFLGVHQCLVFLFIMLASRLIRNKYNALFFIAFYLLYFFNASIVYFRQILALSLIMFMTSSYIYGHKKIFWIGLVVAQSFHNSSIIASIIPCLLWIIEKYHNHIKLIYLSIIVFIGSIYFLFKTLFASLVLIVSEKYDHYFEQEDMRFHKINFCIGFSLLVLTFFSRANDRLRKHTICIVRAFLILYLGFVLLGSLFETANRLADNILSPVMLLYPLVFANRQRRNVFCFLILGILVIMFIINSVFYEGIALTVPYKSKILGIQ